MKDKGFRLILEHIFLTIMGVYIIIDGIVSIVFQLPILYDLFFWGRVVRIIVGILIIYIGLSRRKF